MLADAIETWAVLKPGGILIFDDYAWLGYGSVLPVELRPKLADVGSLAAGVIDFQQRLTLNVAQAFDIDKGGVEEVARWRRDHGQREFSGASRRFVVGHMVGQAIQAQCRQPGAEEFALAGGRGKAALGVRCEQIDHLDAGDEDLRFSRLLGIGRRVLVDGASRRGDIDPYAVLP